MAHGWPGSLRSTHVWLLKGTRPDLIMFSTCRNLIRTLLAMVYSRTHPEDALRYGLGRKKVRYWVLPVRGL